MSDQILSCETCQFWTPIDEELPSHYDCTAIRLGLRECKKATMMDDATDFRKPGAPLAEHERHLPALKTDDASEPDDPIFVELDSRLKMYVQDGSSYRAFLYTKRDFFCAHHELKSSE